MTQALVARRDGDIFQARIFWRRAIRLLRPDAGILKIGFESGPKGFDDIWVEYSPGRAPNDARNNPVIRDHLQCKYHVTLGNYGHAELIDPDFINAQSHSLMKRAHDAQLRYAPAGTGARFCLLTNWQPRNEDVLSDLIRTSQGHLDLAKLFGTKTDNSAAGRVRKLWREHLGITDDELQVLAPTLAFRHLTTTLEEMREELNELLPMAGLRQIPSNESVFPYDDLVIEWVSAGRLEFDHSSLRAACQQEGLVAAAPKQFASYGVKSFEHEFDRLEDRCTEVLDLVPKFNARAIRDESDWSKSLYPQLAKFFRGAAKESPRLQLALDAHASLAFAAGSILNIKSGREIQLEQRSGGYELWSPMDRVSDPNWAKWKFDSPIAATSNSDIIVAISLTHNIQQKVKDYASEKLSSVEPFLHATLTSGASNNGVACGRHAAELAEALVAEVARLRHLGGRVHLFVAGPNAFTFFLGQRQGLLGPITLYEFDFEGARSYTPSLSLPIPPLNAMTL